MRSTLTKANKKWLGIASANLTVLEDSILPKKQRSSLERVVREVDRLVDDPEGDLLLLGSLKDRNSADPSYFDQSYRGP